MHQQARVVQVQGSVPKRGVRGPMDHFMINLDQEDDGEDTGTQINAKEVRNRCALDVGRFFLLKMAFLFMLLVAPLIEPENCYLVSLSKAQLRIDNR